MVLCFVAFTAAARAVDSTTVFNEVMYHPLNPGEPEWIELHNEMAVDMDLTGWRIEGVDFTFPADTVIPAGGHLVIASNPAALQGSTGLAGILGPRSGLLDNAGETLRLENAIGREMDVLTYNDRGRFPVAADGGGVTLARRAPNLGSGDPENWTFSGQAGGTPGAENFPGGQTLGPPATLSAFDEAWNFNQTGADPGADWAQTVFAAGTGGWEAGPGVFAFENDPVALPVGTVLAEPGPSVATHYFQRTFQFSGDPAQTVLELSSLIDDGAVVYLNGFEVARRNMPAGAVDGATRARAAVNNAAVAGPVALPAEHLAAGANVLSVSVHGEAGGPVNGGLALVEQAGAMDSANNVALAANGGAAFAKDLIGNGSFSPTHTIPNLNNGSYGNPSSWIGNSENSFCGIGFGTTVRTLRSVAFGRDNTGAFSDRTLGVCTLQNTTAPNPGAATPDGAWQTVGTLSFSGAGGALFSAPPRRHRFNFNAVQATGFRLITPGGGLASGACIDELELYETAAPGGGGAGGGVTLAPAAGFALAWDGAHLGGEVPDNFARASAGAAAFGSSKLFFNGTHTIAHINDGFYGNPNSWISAGGTGQFIGVAFAGSVEFSRVAWSRDNTGTFNDRSLGGYTIQFTTLPAPGAGTAETGDAATGWQTIGTVTYGAGDPAFAQAVRHEFTCAPDSGGLVTATGVRIKVSDPATCMDELEVAGLPVPDVVFGAKLAARSILPAPGSSALAINELGGSTDAMWRIELRNAGASPLDLAGLVLAASNSAMTFTLPAQSLAPGALIVLDETQLGFRPGLNDRVFLYAAGRSAVLDAARIRSTVRARRGADFLRPITATFGGENQFALTDDVVINEVMFHFPAGTLLAAAPNPEEWIELFNRGANAIDLSGWRLDDAVSFTLPPGTMLPAGGHLVIARDAAALAAKWPGQSTRIVGNFNGSLSNAGERIALLDANGNPADEVRCFPGGAWPERADGKGSSLELRDARADNAIGAAWAASTGGAGAWEDVRYTMPAGQTFGQTLWNEFRIGMLGDGECLVDDVSVVRDPAGAAQELVQGGDFESLADKWRLLGNHGGSAIEPEPGSPGNHVLHVRASGPFSWNHNHVESTFIGNTAVADGQTYRVSFRARWLGGTNQLNTRAYYSRLARTTELTIPPQLGTPGAANSTAVANLGPTLSRLAHSPVVPAAGEPVTIRISASDPDGSERSRCDTR